MPKKSLKVKVSKHVRSNRTLTLHGADTKLWKRLKSQFHFDSDVQFLNFLLDLAEHELEKKSAKKLQDANIILPETTNEFYNEGEASNANLSINESDTNIKVSEKKKKKEILLKKSIIINKKKTRKRKATVSSEDTNNLSENDVPNENKKYLITQNEKINVDSCSSDLSIKIKLCNLKKTKGTKTKKLWTVEDTKRNEDHIKDLNKENNAKDINVDVEYFNDCDDTFSSNSEERLKIDENFTDVSSFAESSLPNEFYLKVIDECHGRSVFTCTCIDKDAVIGPLVGEVVKEMDISDDFDMKYLWEINSGTGRKYLSTGDIDKSNWLRFVRPATTSSQSNLSLFIKEDDIYFLASRQINENEELLYWEDEASSVWSKKKMEKKNCGGCNIVFTHPFYYRKHCIIFHDPSQSLTIRKYHCKVCGLAVLGKEKIMKHAAEFHAGKGAYKCQYCDKFFLRLNYLEMHRTYGCSKNPQRTRPLCDLCGRKFCQPQKLKVHMKRMHSDINLVLKDFQCKLCLKILGSRAALQRHMKEVHSKDIACRCTCERCGKTFQNKSNLKIHMLVHSGVKPFKCQDGECAAAFTTKQCLQFHYKKSHGYTEEQLPRIERSVAYTFDAYSGSARLNRQLNEQGIFEDSHDEVSESSEICVETHNQSETGDIEDKSYLNLKCDDSPLSLIDVEEKPDQRTIVSKGSKKWLGHSEQNLFRRDGSSASLLVEAAISAAEKDQDISTDALSMSSIPSKDGDGDLLQQVEREKSVSPDHYFQFLSKKDGEGRENKEDSEHSKRIQDGKTSPNIFGNNLDLGLSFKYISLPRLNTAFLNEMQKDNYHLNVLKDIEDSEYRLDKEEEYRNREIDAYRTDIDAFRYTDELTYRNDRDDLNGTIDRDFDISSECYRSLEKSINYRSNEVYRSSTPNESQDDGEAQNLCLKGKLDLNYKNYDNLEDFARTGKDSGLDSLLVNDNTRLHTMLSPRYHPTYDAESVDLSVPRATYPTSPIYTLDLTPGRHFDLRNHLGLPASRFTTTRSSSSVPGSQTPPPPCYSLYQSPYMTSPSRHLSPTPQFHHYTGYY